ncbi:MAG TPA: PAS domain S-box protein [Candidatus Acidoferrum sp.]|nr:PAS domain S-box protein [Candidatus Acidoferrum sp.]
MEAALRFLPNTKHVVVVGGMGTFDEPWEVIAKQAFQDFGSKLDFTYLTDLTMPALLERLRHLPSDTIVYHTAISQDAAGAHFIDSAQSVPLVLGAANAPVFVMDDVDLRAGAVGGDLVNWADDARVAADMVVRVLNGEKPQNIPIAKSKHAYVFDWRAMQRWGMKESALPPGSVVLNRPASFWQLYKRYILVGVFVILAQMLAIFALLWQRTKKRETQAELVRTNEQLRLAVEAGKSVGWDIEIESGRTTWFGDLLTMFGLNAEKFVGRNEDFYHYVHPEDRQRVSEAVSKSREHHEPFSAEFRILWPNGTIRWVYDRGEHEYARNGEPKRTFGMAVDITERKRAEEALKQSEQKFSSVFQQSPLAIAITSMQDHRYVDVNETYEYLTAWRRDEVIGRTPLDISLWVDPDQREEFVKLLQAEGSARNFEVRIRRKDGQIRTTLGSSERIECNGEPCALSVFADVSDLKQAEEAERVSENRFRQFFDTLPEYCFMTSADGEILDANPAACKALGYAKTELIGKPLSTIYALGSLSKMVDLLEKWQKTGTLHDEEMTIVTKGGQTRTVLLNAGSVKEANGNLLYSTTVLVDVTERQRAEDAQRRLASIVQSSDDAVLSMSLDGIIQSWNPGAQNMYGYCEAEAVGQPIAMTIPPELQEEEIGILQRLRTGEEIEHYETIRFTKQGERLDVSISMSPVRDSAGNIVAASKIARDITLSKRAEASLRESEERFRLVANAAPVMIWMSGPDKLCNYFNQPWLQFTGRSIQTELGNAWGENVHSDDLSACLETYIKAFDRREPFEMEYRLRRHDGEYRWVLDRGIPRFQQDGSFAGYIGSCIDVTDRRLAEEALGDMSRKLIEAQEQERTWIARELHDDINQRITLVLVNLERWQGDLSPLAPAMTQRLTEIKEHLSSLGSDIQALSHHLHSSKLEYLGLVTAATSFCRELSEEHRVEIEFQSESVPRQLPKEIALCFFRVLQESLQNAVKHSGSRHFEVSLKGTPSKIELTVRDSGVGFDPEEAIRGRGLGLTSMRERLKLVHGELLVDSHPAQGTVIRAEVPLNGRSKAAGA